MTFEIKKWWSVVGAVGMSVAGFSASESAASADAGDATSASAQQPLSEHLLQNGIWQNGIWQNGIWQNGIWQNGIWQNGIWQNGIWQNGIWQNGIWQNGIWQNGIWQNGIWQNGIWQNGIWQNGIWQNGIWQNGALLVGSVGRHSAEADTSLRLRLGSRASAERGDSLQALGEKGFGLRGLSADQLRQFAASNAPVPEENLVSLTLHGGRLAGHTPAGSMLLGPAVVGLVLPFVAADGAIAWIRIADAHADTKATDVYLYTLDFEGANPCGAGVSGTLVPGVWDDSGARWDRFDSSGAVLDTTYSCTTGVLAKCELWGYRPWAVGTELHQACTRMARADYCGDNVSHTENGTSIDVFDVLGVQAASADDALTFEAGWGPDGAVCVREPRYLDFEAAGPVLPSCWDSKPACETWTEASERGALLGNDSAHAKRRVR
jgi:hypothetical protein